MVSTATQLPAELPFKWRQVATPLDVTSAAFAQLVFENDLTVVAAGGYKYAALKTENGFVLYRVFAGWDGIAVKYGQSADPAASADSVLVYTCPAGKRARFNMCQATYVRDANAANVYPVLSVLQVGGATINSYIPLAAALTASVSWIITFARAVYPISTGVYVTGSIPDIFLNAGDYITIYFVGNQATDDCGAFYYQVQEAPA